MQRDKPRSRILAGILLAVTVAGLVVVVRQQSFGPLLFSLTSSQGVDGGDVLLVPLVWLAVMFARRAGAGNGRLRDAPAGLVAPVSALVLGGLLVVSGTAVLAHGGVMLPTGGATFDGEISFVAGPAGVRVGSWQHVAASYDGTVLQLYIDGVPVREVTLRGALKRSTDPLWIGGNEPYGEHFIGLIDEVRIYDRALGEDHIRRDMRTPIAELTNRAIVDAGLVAAYGFDAVEGALVIDASPHGNDGLIEGAGRTALGRFGGALMFDGNDRVRIDGSDSLDLSDSFTLSAWIAPKTVQHGWRTIIHRQTDAYFLTLGPEHDGRPSPLDSTGGLALIGASALFVGAETLRTRGRWLGDRWRRGWRVGFCLFIAGSFVDLLLGQSATTLGVGLLAAWLAVTSDRRIDSVSLWLLTAVLAAAGIAARVDAGFASRLAAHEGSNARTAALGALLVVVAVLRLDRRTRVAVRDGPPAADTPTGLPASTLGAHPVGG